MKIRAIIVDDEPDARESILLIVKQFFSEDLEIIDSVSSVKEAVKSINSLKPDLVFLDVEMPNENGLKLFEYYGNNNDFEVVFITAFQEYALSAFRYAALDYLLKPVDYKQFGEAIERFKRTDHNYSKLRIETYLSNLSNDSEINKTILLPAKNGFNVVKINSILYCKADGNYSNIYTLDGKSFLLTSILKNLEERLPDTIFFRTHKSFLVNLNYVKKVDKTKNLIFLENDKVVEIASRRVNEFEKVLKSI